MCRRRSEGWRKSRERKGREGKVREVGQAVQDQRSVQKGGEIKSNQISRRPKKQKLLCYTPEEGREGGREGRMDGKR